MASSPWPHDDLEPAMPSQDQGNGKRRMVTEKIAGCKVSAGFG